MNFTTDESNSIVNQIAIDISSKCLPDLKAQVKLFISKKYPYIKIDSENRKPEALLLIKPIYKELIKLFPELDEVEANFKPEDDFLIWFGYKALELPQEELCLRVAHELRHIYQHETDQIAFAKDYFIDLIFDIYEVRGLDLATDIDATEFARGICSGEVVTKSDWIKLSNEKYDQNKHLIDPIFDQIKYKSNQGSFEVTIGRIQNEIEERKTTLNQSVVNLFNYYYSICC